MRVDLARVSAGPAVQKNREQAPFSRSAYSLGVQTRIRDDPALDGDVHQANKLSGVRSLAAGFGELDSFHTCRARYLRVSAAAHLKVSFHQSSRPKHRPI